MKKLAVILTVALAAPSGAKVWITAYRSDGVTPLAVVDPNQPTVYRDTMVGTRLVLVVASDAPGVFHFSPPSLPVPDIPIPGYIPGVSVDWLVWNGTLLIPWADSEQRMLTGALSGRGYNKQTFSYDGSILAAAGQPPKAKVRYLDSTAGAGFGFTAERLSVAGDWFVFDYRAERTGTCAVLFSQPADLGVPTEVLSFRHVPSRDFNGDTVVDFRDFALLASRWNSAVSADPNGPSGAFDLNGDARVDFGDLALFSEYWLERTDSATSPDDCNGPPTL